MSEFKERTDNPLHKAYGLRDNTIYLIKKTWKYDAFVLILSFFVMAAESVVSYYWGFVTRFIIDMVGRDGTVDVKNALLLKGMIGFTAVALVLHTLTLMGNIVYIRHLGVRMKIITERVSAALTMPYGMLERPEVLDLHERAIQSTSGNDKGIEGMSHLMMQLGTQLVTVIVTLTSVVMLDFRLIIALTILTLIQFVCYDRIIKKDKKEVWDRLSPLWRRNSYMARVTQDFDYAKDIRLFDMAKFLTKKQKKVYREKEKILAHHEDLWLWHAFMTRFLFMAGEILIYAVLVWTFLKKDMSIGDFTLFYALAHAFSGALLEFMHRFGDYKRASLELDDFRSFMDLSADKASGSRPVPKGPYTIKFNHVSYRYHGSEKDALSDLTLTLNPGTKLAVVGLNGAGKTTMIKLLLRLYDPTEGVITLNGIDIHEFDRAEWYTLFAPAFQETELFAFPMAENISMAPADKTDTEKAKQAAILAGLGEKVDSLPKGIMTDLLKIASDDGIDLSGGEKQKLALAKALYKDAPIVVLDEPTAALDALAEKALYERFDRIIGEKSAVYISHRLASTRFCDAIAVFENGSMTEYGTHEELMNRGGSYAHLFEVQAQYYREEGGDEHV